MKRRIAVISEHASPLAILGGVDSGGQNVYVAEISKQLAGQYDVDVFTRKDSAEQNEIVEWEKGVRVIHIKAGPEKFVEKERLLIYMKEFTVNMLKFIQESDLKYDIVHANFFMSALVASEIKHALSIPYVVTFHALGYVRRAYQKENDKFPPERCSLEKFIIKDANHIIAECPQDKDDLIHYYDADPSRITIIPCGFNPSEFHCINKSEARTALGLKEDEFILLQLGRMVPRKGVDNVVMALSHLKDNANIKLLVVGGESEEPDPLLTPEINRLYNLAKETGVENKVTFTGKRSRKVLKYYYSAADVFITTPWYEPFGITPLEAMACGTPVIGSNVGGIKYSVSDGRTGFLVPPKDPVALAEKIDQLAGNRSILDMMKSNAIKHVNRLFTWRKITNTIRELFEKTIRLYNSSPSDKKIISLRKPVMALDNIHEIASLAG